MTANLEVYQRTDNLWAWRLTVNNGNILATDGGQGYANRSDYEQTGLAVISGTYAPPTQATLRCDICGAELAGEGGRIDHMPDGTHTWAPNPA